MVESQCLFALTDRIYNQTGDHRTDRVESIFELRNDTEIRTSAADTPEQLNVFVGTRRDELSVRGNDVDRQDVIAGKSVFTVQPAVPSTERKSCGERTASHSPCTDQN